MEQENINKLNELLDNITNSNIPEEKIEEIRMDIKNSNFTQALEKLQEIYQKQDSINHLVLKRNFDNTYNTDIEEDDTEEIEIENNDTDNENNTNNNNENNKNNYNENLELQETSKENNKKISIYPDDLKDENLETIYIGMLLNNPKLISNFYFIYEDCFFENPELLNLYKSILFTEGESYAPEIAKNGFNFAKDSIDVYEFKNKTKESLANKKYNFEKIYVELKKLFILRKYYSLTPLSDLQKKIIEIKHYKLYDKMSAEEVLDAVNQVTSTSKFKRSILNINLTKFLEERNNTLTNGIPMPFNILSTVFKGIRKGETMAFAMPSNAGKSRFTINLASYTSLVQKKKVLVISNEMSEDKMKLCLITTILNNPEIQKIHGQKIKKSETELLEFKFRPDNAESVETDEDGFIVKRANESQEDFVKRLSKISTEFVQTINATNWVNDQFNNSIHFINITDHTNDELKKVILNYYYKEKIEYVFYDTLKTDTENIGNGEELKKTATILSNLAQNFNIFICSTLQLSENSTPPIDLNVNDLAVSKTIKEVLDTLCLIKQINNNSYDKYEYSLNEVDTKFYNLQKFEDPNVRYYACIVDKNRAGAKPKLLFRLNLAYNSWEELGFLRLKEN